MNPLGNGGGMPQNNNPISFLMNFMNGGGNPQQLFEQMMRSNPQAKSTMEHLKNVSNGAHPRDILKQVCKQKGIDPAQLDQLVKKMGLQ